VCSSDLVPAEGEYAAAARLQRIWALLGATDLNGAVREARAYLERYPDGQAPVVHYLLGAALFRKAEYAAAAPAYRAAAEAAGESPYREEAAFQLALCYERLGESEAAVAAYTAFAERFPESDALPTAVLSRAEGLARRKRWEDAAEAFRSVRDLDGATAAQKEQSWLQQAVCHYEQKQYDAMDACYRSLLEHYPRSANAPEALYWAAWGAQRRKQYGEAVGLYRRFLKEHPEHALADRTRYRLGMTLYQAGKEAEAAEVFYGILTERPNVRMAQEELLWLGSYYLQHDNPEKADEAYTALLERHPGPKMDAATRYYRAEAKRRKAIRADRKEAWETAADSFRQLAERDDPRFNALARFGLGQCLRELGRLDEARAALRVVEFAPEDPMQARLLFELALLDEAQDRTESAVRRFLRVGLLYDDQELCGEALFRAGRLSEAAGDLEKAMVCYRELADDRAGSYGARYGKTSPWSAQARERIHAIEMPPAANVPEGETGDEATADGEKVF